MVLLPSCFGFYEGSFMCSLSAPSRLISIYVDNSIKHKFLLLSSEETRKNMYYVDLSEKVKNINLSIEDFD